VGQLAQSGIGFGAQYSQDAAFFQSFPRLEVAGNRGIGYIIHPISTWTLSVKKLVIAIDGPAASGKTTTARLVAARLGYLHIDTGAMYRAVTAKVLKLNIAVGDVRRIAQLVNETRVEMRDANGSLRVLIDGEDVTQEIRSAEVTRNVSAISSIGEVRSAMVRKQRRLAAGGGVVLEGRDIGTVVFPGADLKIFMVAGIESRARRRQQELREKGIIVSLDKLKKEIGERDRLDSTRAQSPLKKASDAIELDTSNMTVEEQVDFVVKKAQEIIERAGA